MLSKKAIAKRKKKLKIHLNDRCCACNRNKESDPKLKLYIWAGLSRVCRECAEEHLTAEAFKKMTGIKSKKETTS